MINSIPQIESDKYKSFGNMTNVRKPSDYWLMPSSVTQEDEFAQFRNRHSNMFDAGKILITPDEARKTKNIAIIGTSIAGATLLTAAGLFFFLKGGPKGLPKYFQKLKAALIKKVQTSRLDNDGNISLRSKAYIYMIKSIDGTLKKFEAVNNFTSFKDQVFKKLMYRTKLGKKIHDGITKTFERIGRQAVVSTYRDTSSRISMLGALAKNSYIKGKAAGAAFVNGERIPKDKAFDMLARLNDELAQSYEKSFGKDPLQSRYHYLKKAVEDLKLRFSKLNVFWSRGVYSEFMAEAAMLKEKSIVQNLVRGYRKEISYSYADMASEVQNKIIKMTDLFSYKDADKIKQLRSIMLNVKKYVKNPSANHVLKEQIAADIDSLSNTFKRMMQTEGADKKLCEQVLSDLSEIRNGFMHFKQGKVEDILDIYRQILPKKEFKKIEKEYNSAVKSLDKSIQIETEDFASKLRDFSLGSAPTDILTVLGSLGVLGYHLKKSDNNDQRMSISLKYGIPALAGIGTALYCNAKLYAGSKSLIFGTASTFIVNKIGVYVDNLRKKYSKNNQVDNSVKA